jgi:hypothetical protein
MGMVGFDTLQSWRVLGIILAMISEVKILFILLGYKVTARATVPNYLRYLEQDTIW